MSSLVLPYTALWEILDKVPYPEIGNFCQVSKSFLAHCRSNSYWRHRIETELRIPAHRQDTRATFDRMYRCLNNPGKMRSCLEQAAREKNYRLLEVYLRDMIANPEKYRRHRRAIYEAMIAAGLLGQTDLIYQLIGSPPNQASLGGVLEGAAERDNQELIQTLLEGLGENRDTYLGNLLTGAARGGHLDHVRQYLNRLDQISDFDANRLNYSALAAAKNQHLDVVSYLVEQGADPNYFLSEITRMGLREMMIPFFSRNTFLAPVEGAVRGKHKELYREIIGEIERLYGQESAQYARTKSFEEATYTNQWDLAQEIFQQGIDPGVINFVMKTFGRRGLLGPIDRLLAMGGDINQALAGAIEGNQGIIDELINRGASMAPWLPNPGS